MKVARNLLAATTLLLLLPSLMARAQDDDLPFDVKAQAWKNIKITIQMIRKGQVGSLAARVVYPLKRENPLPDVSSRSEFARTYEVLFDSTLKKALVGLKASDLFQHEGDWSYGEGDVWFNPDGKIIAINYSSVEERRRKDSLTDATYKLMYPGIARGKRNVLVCKAGKRLIRIDEVGDDLRYIAWGEGKTISDKPDLVLYKGEQKVDGTGGSYTITFLNGPWTYSFEYISMVDSGEGFSAGLFLHVSKGGKEVARYVCRQMK